MISIYNSRTVRATSTARDALNDLARHWDGWHHIVDDQDNVIAVSDLTNTTVVKEIWVSENIYISVTTTSTPNVAVTHTSGATQPAASNAFYSKFLIITTETGVILRREPSDGKNSKTFIAVGKTIDSTETESCGVVFKPSAMSPNVYMFTDNMSTTADSVALDGVGASTYNTVLAPLYALAGDEHFTDLMYVVISKPTDEDKGIINNQKYYVYSAVALPYTEE